ncbi:MAG: hypothetical protein K0S68_863 [Candidatus Saccharibacteria bacterium]|jgi:hypothetical protein|nr:hypothetical protein [Candidatus Saccharibacteria bacterium]
MAAGTKASPALPAVTNPITEGPHVVLRALSDDDVARQARQTLLQASRIGEGEFVAGFCDALVGMLDDAPSSEIPLRSIVDAYRGPALVDRAVQWVQSPGPLSDTTAREALHDLERIHPQLPPHHQGKLAAVAAVIKAA